MGVFVPEPGIVFRSEAKSRNSRLLQRRGSSHCQEVMHLLRHINDMRRGNNISEPPSCDRIGFGQGGAGYRPLPHSRQRSKIDMPVRFIDYVFIHFVCNDKRIVLLRKLRDQLQLPEGEYLPARIGGVAQDQSFRMLPKRGFKLVRIEAELRGIKRNIDGFRSGKDRVCAVVLIKRREHDDLIPRVCHSHHGGHHRFSAAAGHNDLPVRIDLPAHQGGLLFRQRFPEVLCSPCDGILVIVFFGHLRQAVENLLRRIKIRETL